MSTLFRFLRRWLFRTVLLLILLVPLLFIGLVVWPLWGLRYFVEAPRVPITPEWALEPWLWEDDVNTAEYVEELLAGYKEHDIPVRTILLDSPWSTRYNDFKVDEARYPNPEQFFTSLQNRGYRVVLWMTTMVNSESDDTAIQESDDWFQEAAGKGYLANDGKQTKWWKGRGGFIDYTNPEAMTWWRGMQQQVLDWGIDGWKLDGTATLFGTPIKNFPLPLGYGTSHSGILTTRQYMDLYYGEEYRHGLTQNPEFITLARAIDDLVPYVHPNGFAPLDAAPVTWVGDQDHTWSAEEEGLEEAIQYILKSADKGYSIIGSDVGGYGGKDIPKNLYIRWAQFSAFCGLYLQGGHGNRALWERSQEELEIIRKFTWLHSELVPYIWHHMNLQHEERAPLMRPVEDYQYFFGPDLFVAPIYRDSPTRTVSLPSGRWRYFFGDQEVIEGPTNLTRDFSLSEFPVYVRDGAILPMRISRPYTGIGDRDWEGMLTLNIYPHGESSQEFRLSGGKANLRVRCDMGERLSLQVEQGATPQPLILRLLLTSKPLEVNRGGAALAEGQGWLYDFERRRLLITQAEALAEADYEMVLVDRDSSVARASSP